MLGVPLGAWLLLDGQSWRLAVGPALLGVWGVLGAYLDLWRPRSWRSHPIVWSVLLPFLGLYFFAQMFLWWPLWDLERTAWTLFLALFVVNTALNIRGHLEVRA